MARLHRSLGLLAVIALLSGAAPTAQAQMRYAPGSGTAVLLSFAGTAVPVGLGLASRGGSKAKLILGGIVLGPALGYVYEGETGRGMAHAAVRGAVLAAAVGGAYAICAAGDCSIGIFGGRSGDALVPAVVVLLGGFVATTILAANDIHNVGQATRERNHAALSVQPAFFPASRTTGVLVTWRH